VRGSRDTKKGPPLTATTAPAVGGLVRKFVAPHDLLQSPPLAKTIEYLLHASERAIRVRQYHRPILAFMDWRTHRDDVKDVTDEEINEAFRALGVGLSVMSVAQVVRHEDEFKRPRRWQRFRAAPFGRGGEEAGS
jgi:hypothetical protein